MNDPISKASSSAGKTPKAARRYEISRRDLPLHCPVDAADLWNTHPRVFLPIEETGEATCPYCGSHYTLKD